MLSDKEFEDQIRNRFTDFEGELPEFGWKKINLEVNHQIRWWNRASFLIALGFLVPILTLTSDRAVNSESLGLNEPFNFTEATFLAVPEGLNKEPYNFENSSPVNKDFEALGKALNSETIDQKNSREAAIVNSQSSTERSVPASSSQNKNSSFRHSVFKNLSSSKLPGGKDLLIIDQITSIDYTYSSEFDINRSETTADHKSFERGDSLIDSLQVEIVSFSEVNSPIIPQKSKQEKKMKVKRGIFVETIGAFYSSNLTYKFLSPNQNDAVSVLDLGRTSLSSRVGNEAGINLGGRINEKLTFNTELSFVKLNEKHLLNTNYGKIDSLIVERTPGSNSFTVTPVFAPEKLETFSSNYFYSGLTFTSTYLLGNFSNNHFYLGGGAGINYLVRGITTISSKEQEEKGFLSSSEGSFGQMNYRLTAVAGYNYWLNEKTAIYLEPTFNFYLLTSNSNLAPASVRPYTFGVKAGIKFNRDK
jgi:hypothetical protein